VIALSGLLPISSAMAQIALPEGVPPANVTCPGGAVFSAGSGPEVQVTRIGILDQRNPLAPLTDAPSLSVVEVRIRGKLAAAYGPGFDAMRRGGPPEDLEREFGNAIRWEPNLASLPRNLQIVAEDSAEVIAKLRFVKCLTPGKARPERERAIRPNEAPAPVPRAVPLPRGALQ
jgi:hypothetical protein